MKSKYILIKQKPFCCVPACIQMVLSRRKIKILSQEEIGNELGLRYGWGTQIDKSKYSLNKFFKNHKIKLNYRYYNVTKIKNIEDWVNKNIEKNNDILVCFNNKKLYGEKGIEGGHVCILEKIKSKEAILIDPGKKREKVKIKDLINAMRYHGKKNLGGFWLIKWKK